MRRRFALLIAAALTAASATWTASAQTTSSDGNQGNGGNNSAVAVNTKDGSSVFDIAFSIVHATGSSVTNTNTALAYASCTSCQTVAIAFQVVLVTGDPSTVAPVNQAVAINDQCTLCSTLADAVQFVVTTSGPVTFTAEGWREIAEIRRQLERLRHSHLSIEQIAAIVEQLKQQVAHVLATQLVPVGPGHEEDSPNSSPETSPSAEATPLSTASATATATASPSATPASTVSASPSPAQATATPTP